MVPTKNCAAVRAPLGLMLGLGAATLLCGCTAPKPVSADATAARPAAAALALPAAPAGPANSPVSRAGAQGAVPLDPGGRRDLAEALAKLGKTDRSRLRYALASTDDGTRRLVVYDGGGLDAAGRRPGKAHAYVIFRVLNTGRDDHYDPQQNALIAPITPPPERDSAPRGR